MNKTAADIGLINVSLYKYKSIIKTSYLKHPVVTIQLIKRVKTIIRKKPNL